MAHGNGKPTAGRRRSRRATSVDVARLAGVSQSAVSRCFTPGASISERTRSKILAAAERLGYAPNAIARSLISGRSRIVGVVLPNITNLFYPEVLHELSQRLQSAGLRVLLFTVPYGRQIDDVMPDVLQYQVDGIIASARCSPAVAANCQRRGVPIVFYNREYPDLPGSSVKCNQAAGAARLAELLVASGHRRFGMIAGPDNSPTARDRERGFVAQLRERGIELSARANGQFLYDVARAAARALLGTRRRPDALFCANDTMAFGAMDAARHDLSLSVPDDVSIVGFDDSGPSRWRAYDLTTVRQPIEAMTATAVELLVQHLANASLPVVRRQIDGELVVRSSARAAARAPRR